MAATLKKYAIERSAPAFADIVKAHNGLLALIAQMRGKNGVKITITDENIVFEIGGGATFEQFTICDNGVPATRYWPTWTTNPTNPSA